MSLLYTDLLFVFAFLPLSIVVSFFDRSAEYKNLVLIISSLIFFSWGSPAIMLLLFVTAVFDYLFGLLAARKNKIARLAGLSLDLMMNAAAFVVFSYNFLFRSGGIFSKFEFLAFADKLIPLGIGFYTLRGASYVLDVYFKRTPVEKNPFCILTYMVNFHLLLAGPVVPYDSVRRQIRKRTISPQDLSVGLSRFVLGLGKAAVLSPVFYELSQTGLDFANITFVGAWAGMAGFIAYVYWIFAGFNDMALGLGRMGGFIYPENVKSLRLDRYVRGIATGFNRTVVGFFRRNLICRKNTPAYVATTFITALFVGLWYSLSFGSVAGSLILALMIILERKALSRFFHSKPPLIGNVYTVCFSLLGIGMFAFEQKWQLRAWALSFLGVKTSSFTNEALNHIILQNFVLIAFGILLMLPFVNKAVKALFKRLESSEKTYGVSRILKTLGTATVLVMYTVTAYFAL